MNHSLISSAVTLRGLQQKLDMISHNVSNIHTTGYKRKEASFVDVLSGIQQQDPELIQSGRLTPPGYAVGAGARLGLLRTDLSQGSLKETNDPLDMAIEGNAMFEVAVPFQDADGNVTYETRWTRDGAFSFSIHPEDSEMVYLTTKAGHFVRGIDDEPIQIPIHHRMEVRGDGSIYAYDERNPSAAPIAVGQMKLMQVVRPEALESDGANLFRLPDSYDAERDTLLLAIHEQEITGEIASIKVKQGFLEQSNVDLTKEMSDLLVVQRAYQLSSRAIQSADAMMNIANNLRG